MNPRGFALVCLTICMVLALSQFVYAAQETRVTLDFDKDQFSFDQARGYDRVLMTDGSVIARPGEPSLPAKQILVAIPAGAGAVAVRVRSLDSEELSGTYQIYPAQPPARLDGSPPPPFVEPDDGIYLSTAEYPGELGRLSGQTDLAGQQMAVVTVHPVQYSPANGRLILHRHLEITVESQPGHISSESYVKFTEKQREHYSKMVRGMVVNPLEVNLDPPMRAPSKSLPTGSFDHVVITSSSYASYFDDLIEWHNKRGLRDTVITTSYIYSNYSGSDDPEKIRNFVIDAHSAWGAMYFLMGGEDGTVPFKDRLYYDETTPSDHYYSDYDDDWTCEVYVGRISGSSSTQFDTAIDKILEYEKSPPTSNYARDILLSGMDLTIPPEYPLTPAEDLKEIIDGYIPSGHNVTKIYDSHGGDHEANTISALNAGQNLFNHADHSNSTVLGLGYLNHGSWALYNSDVDGLTNNSQPSNVISMGCWANDMTYSDGIAEHFVIYNPDQAGVSFSGNTRSGWFYIGYVDELSCKMDKEWWRSLFSYNKYNLGEILADCKNRNQPPGYDYDIEWHVRWTFCLLGDPAMPVWTDDPASITVTHPSTLPTGSSSFLVHVESGGGDLNNAYVCLWKEGDIYETGYTNSSGDVTLNPSPGSTGTMYVTVTKQDYLPHEGDADVITGGSDPSITVTYPNGGETLSGSATINWTATDPDPGETTALDIDLEYSANGGGNWNPIAIGETNDGSYLWDVSGLSDGSNFLARATATDPTMRSDTDESDGVFSIQNTGPPATIADLTATLAVDAIHLGWTAVTQDVGGLPIVVDHYVIYRNGDPKFSPTSPDSVGSTAGTSYEDPTPALKDPGTNHYYVVKAVDSMGRKSADSNRAGEFDAPMINDPPTR